MEASDIAFAYGSNVMLESAGFSAARGEFIALLGLNGAGRARSSIFWPACAPRIPVRFGSMAAHFSSGRPATVRRPISHLPQGIRGELPFTVEQIVLMGRYAYADEWFESEEDAQSRRPRRWIACSALPTGTVSITP